MKKFTKFIALLLCLISCFSLVACGDDNDNSGNNPSGSKSILYIRYMNAGYGDRWLTAAEKRFEKMYENISFETGKTGVDIIIDPAQTSATFLTDMETQRDHIYFCEAYNQVSYVAANVMEDLTAALTTSLGESYGVDANGNPLPAYQGETKSVYEKMSVAEKEYYVLKENGQNKIYSVPYIDSANGALTYDADVFEKYALYYKADNTMGATKGAGKATTVKLGTGPDGVEGTADDGLPRTYSEFFAVCRKMKSACGTMPFIWCGNWVPYVTELADNLARQNMGVTQHKAVLNGMGVIDDYIDGGITYNASQKTYNYTTKKQNFAAGNFNDVFHSASILHAVDFIYQIIQGNYVDKNNAFNAAYSHEIAQSDFFFGKHAADTDFGFLVDGTWWYNEAEKYILQYENRVADRDTRNVQYMALPKADEATFERTKGANVVSGNYINAITVKKGLSAQKKLLAETFVRFFCTDESLAEYNVIVSQPRGLDYKLTDEQYNQLSPYGKSLYGVKSGDERYGYQTYQYLPVRAGNQFFKENATMLKVGFMTSTPSGYSQMKDVATAFNDNISKGLNALKYFNGIIALNG